MADHKKDVQEWAGELAELAGKLLNHLAKRPHAGLPAPLEGSAAVAQAHLDSLVPHARAASAEPATK